MRHLLSASAVVKRQRSANGVLDTGAHGRRCRGKGVSQGCLGPSFSGREAVITTSEEAPLQCSLGSSCSWLSSLKLWRYQIKKCSWIRCPACLKPGLGADEKQGWTKMSRWHCWRSQISKRLGVGWAGNKEESRNLALQEQKPEGHVGLPWGAAFLSGFLVCGVAGNEEPVGTG